MQQNKILQKDFDDFEKLLLEYPDEGDVIPGTGGLRKIRLKSATKGKRGSFRVCYLDLPEKEKLYLLLIYAKNEQEDLTNEEKKILKSLTDQLRKE